MGEIVFLLIVFAIWLVVFLIIRQLVLWYWRINHMIERQDKQNELLERIAGLLEKQIKLQQETKAESSIERSVEKQAAHEEKNQQAEGKSKEPDKVFKKGDAVHYFGKLLLIKDLNSDGTYACTLPDGTFYGDIESSKLKMS